jgi:hypothetical protein
MTAFWIVVSDPTDTTKLGEIHSAKSFDSSNPLDKAGDFKFVMPATDPKVVLLDNKNIVRCYSIRLKTVTLLATGIIDNVQLQVDNNAQFNGMLEVSGSSIARELTYRDVGALSLSNTNTGPQLIMALAPPGWTIDVGQGYDTTLTPVSHDFEGGTVLDALIWLAQTTGEHFWIAPSARKLVWMQKDTPSSGYRALKGGDPISLESNESACIVLNIKREYDTFDLVSRVKPRGSGTGSAKITLSGTTWTPPAGYTLDAGNNYIRNDQAEIDYGQIERVVDFKDISSADTLALAAYSWLEKNSQTLTAYRLKVGGLRQTLQPGRTIRVEYRRYIRLLDGSQFKAYDIDENLIVMENSLSLDSDGVQTNELLVTTIARYPTTEADAIVAGMTQADNSFTYSQPADPGTIGVLDISQYPNAILRDGSRSLLGDMAVAAGKKIDGVDLDVHASNAQAHHNYVTIGTGGLSSKLGITGGQVLTLGAINHTDISNVLPDQHHDPVTAGNTAIGLSTQVVSLVLAASPGLVISNGLAMGTPGTLDSGTSNDVTLNSHHHAVTAYADATIAGQEGHLLKSDGSGDVKLHKATLTDRLTATLVDTPVGTSLTLRPADNIYLSPGANLISITASARIQTDNYASQTTGWGISYAGGADFRYIYSDEMHIRTFFADREAIRAGILGVYPSGSALAADFTVPAAGANADLVVETFKGFDTFRVFLDGEFVNIRQFSRASDSFDVTDCWGTVVWASTDTTNHSQTYTFTRSTAPNAGAATDGTVIAAGATAPDYGTSGMGWIEQNAIDGYRGENSPYIQTVSWTGHPASGKVVRTREGNLYGLFAQTNEYGLYVGTGVTTTDKYIRVSSYTAELHNLPLHLFANTTQVITLEPGANPYFAIGNPIPTGWLSQSGIWSGRHTDGTYRLYIGSVSGGALAAGIQWDGTTMTVKGIVTIQAGSAGIGNLSDAGVLATVDNLDGVPNGSTYVKTNQNQATGGTRAYNALDGTYQLTTRVKPGSNVSLSGAGLYLGANFMGYYDGGNWKTYIDNGGNMKLLGDSSSNYLIWNASMNRLRGIGGNTEQWYADATDGMLKAGNSVVALSVNGLELVQGGSGAHLISWRTAFGGTIVASIGGISAGLLGNYELDLFATDISIGAGSGYGNIFIHRSTTHTSSQISMDAGDISISSYASTLTLGANTLDASFTSGILALGTGKITSSIALGARVYRNSNQSIANNTETAISFNTEVRDDDNIWASGSPTRLTCKHAGWYHIVGNIHVDQNTVGVTQARIRLNGSTWIAIANQDVSSTSNEIIIVSTDYYLSVYDYVELTIYQNSGGALNVNYQSVFSPVFSMVRYA